MDVECEGKGETLGHECTDLFPTVEPKSARIEQYRCEVGGINKVQIRRKAAREKFDSSLRG